MRTTSKLLLKVAVVVLLVGCVNIVINFPAAEVKEAARKIEKDVRAPTPEPPAPAPSPDGGMRREAPFSFGVNVAVAADVDLNVDTPGIRAAKASRKARYVQLKPHLDSGVLGEAKTGLIAVRKSDGLDARTRVTLNQLVSAENKDRTDIFKEITAKIPGASVEQVQAQFARAIRLEMEKAQWFEDDSGVWSQKK